MGLSEKPLVTVWNKMDACTDKRELMAFEAEKRGSTVPMSALTGEGLQDFQTALQVRFVQINKLGYHAQWVCVCVIQNNASLVLL